MLIIHQIWFDFSNGRSMSNDSIEISKKWKELNGECEYRLWSLSDAKEFISKEYPEYMGVFAVVEKPEFKFKICLCDFFRYLVVYHFGGIYVDLDFYPIKSVKEFLSESWKGNLDLQKKSRVPKGVSNVILTEEWYESYSISNSIHNGFLCSVKEKHPFWNKLISDCYRVIVFSPEKIATENDVWELTGTRKLKQHLEHFGKFFEDVGCLKYHHVCPFISIEDSKQLPCNGVQQPCVEKGTNWVCYPYVFMKDLEKRTDGGAYMNNIFPKSFFLCCGVQGGSLWR